MKNKKLLLIISAVLLVLVLAGTVLLVCSCGKGNFGASFDPSGFNDSSIIHQGGSDASGMNLKQLLVTAQEGGIVAVTLRFTDAATGSAGNVPGYTLAFLGQPLRMQLNFSGLEMWDYTMEGSPEDSTGLLAGEFHVIPVNDSTTELYFNLTRPVTYRLTEGDDGSLTIELKPDGELTKTSWFTVINAFSEYRNGTIPAEANLAPTLCSDKASVLLISAPFPSQAEAEAEMSSLQNSYAASFSGKEFRILSLDGNQLPAYEDEADLQTLSNASILNVDGKDVCYSVFFADARFLCWLPDLSGALYAKKTGGAEMLYTVSSNGAKHILIDNELAMISLAAWSGDGNVLAFVEQADDVQICSVYSTVTHELIPLDDASVFEGEFTGIALNEDGSVLYAMNGAEQLQLKAYDLKTHSTEVLARGDLPTSLICSNGSLFFISYADGRDQLLRLELASHSVLPLGDALYFQLSRDGRQALLVSENTESADGSQCVTLLDLSTGTRTAVISGITIGDFFFASDGSAFYYTTDSGAENSNFLLALNRYNISDGTTQRLALSVNAAFYPSSDPHEVVINVNYTKQERDYPAVYIVKLS